MRALLRPLSKHTAFSPIETIVTVFVLATLAYFHILSGIKHSSFFEATQPPTLRPAYARLTNGEWVAVTKHDWAEAWKQSGSDVEALELQQLVFSLDDKARTAAQLDASAVAQHLVSELPSLSGKTYPSICHHSGPNVSSISCFTTVSEAGASPSLTLSFQPGHRDDWMAALRRENTIFVDGMKYEVDAGKRHISIGEMKSSKWVAYALSALVLRFWELAKKADSLDILVVLTGYILMHVTFMRLFLSSRALGSNFWLSTGIFSSAIISFLFTLPFCRSLDIPLDPIALTEALPFLVCTVGFDKPLRLARAVMAHPHMIKPQENGRMKPAGEVILEALDRVGNVILRDYALEIAVLFVGVNSRVGGLKEFCAVAAVALAMDCVMTFTLYTSVLTVMVEVRRIKKVREMTRSRSSSITAVTANGTAVRGALSRTASKTNLAAAQTEEPKNLRERVSNSVIGEKGSLLKDGPRMDEVENPMARLKLLLIASFLTLHILNFCTTLTPATANARHQRHPLRSAQEIVPAPRVDITSPAIASVLANLAVSEQAQTGEPVELVVKVAPPVYVHATATITAIHHSSKAGTGEAIENFMSSWSSLVGDPVISKWIVALLAISVALNGYLLKGIAAGSGLAAMRAVRTQGVRFRSRARSIKISEDPEEEEHGPAPVMIMASAAPAVAAPEPAPIRELETAPVVQPPSSVLSRPLNLETIDRKLQERLPIRSPAPFEPRTPETPEVPQMEMRSLAECVDVFENGPRPVSVALRLLNDEEVILLAQTGKIAPYALEKMLDDLDRAVKIRRALISRASRTKTLESSLIPMKDYDYSRVMGACCENVVGYMPLPLGIAGPLKIDGLMYPIPMATAEGTLVASTSRGCKALNSGGGVTTVLTYDGMTRGPAIDFPSIVRAAEAMAFIESEEGYTAVRDAFESTSRFAKLLKIKCALAGRTLFVRFATRTGDAMGMNMISKATEAALAVLTQAFPEMVVLCLSGNYCTDKKPAAINWIEGRGKSIVAEAVIPGRIVKSVLKTTVEALCNVNVKKNLVGSAMAGSVGGFNAHAANILTAIFLATGQDPAQNVESSNCMTLMEPTNNGEDLLVTVSMPCIEVGTVGGGTILAPQQAVLELLGVKGAHPTNPGQNAQQLARIIAAAVMAGELSLLSALAAGHLVRAHLAHNRSQLNTPMPSRPQTPGLEEQQAHQLGAPPAGEPKPYSVEAK
ncbi:3-hydroxy-3-methylglutaryl-coenzyme A reductase [Lenzites betulinus]|nr:3-hydroxy-3-methylglutaryl-coenzyme A reductase [Lenzites betulinus]